MLLYLAHHDHAPCALADFANITIWFTTKLLTSLPAGRPGTTAGSFLAQQGTEDSLDTAGVKSLQMLAARDQL